MPRAAPPLPAPGARRAAASAALGLAAYACAVVLLTGALGFTTRWYGFFDLADTPLYHAYATAMDRGLRPFVDFPAEYPSAALRLFALPGHPASLPAYAAWFAATMLVAMGGAAVLTSLSAARLWPSRGAAAVVAAGFSLSVLALGGIVPNRFDAAVALAIALFLWGVVGHRWTVAALALGLGTALKLTPAVLLPLPLLLAAGWRERARIAGVFGAAAVAPFLLLDGAAAWKGVVTVFRFHGARPLQAESVLSTPVLLARLFGAEGIATGNAFGGQILVGPGTPALAAVSGPLAILLLGTVAALAWRARRCGMDERRWVPLFAVALLLAVVAPAKVLSPQYLVWLVPAAALLAPAARGLAGLLFAVFVLTGIEFPALYWDFVDLRPGPVLLVVVRNVALAAALGWVAVLLAKGGREALGDPSALTAGGAETAAGGGRRQLRGEERPESRSGTGA